MLVSAANYFDHMADMGIVGFGSTIEQSFVNAAEALFAFMIEDIEAINREEVISFQFEESDIELAFLTWLNTLLSEADSHQLRLGHFILNRQGSHWKGCAYGEKWKASSKRGTEVKGATFTMLSVRQQEGQWQARCVVDV